MPGTVRADAVVDAEGLLTVTDTIDLEGGTRVLTGVRAMTGTGEFTDSKGGGRLVLEIVEGATVVNGRDSCQVRFSGGLGLVKSGAGTLSIANSAKGGIAAHDFTGGIEVLAGTLRTDKYGNIEDRLATKNKPTPFGFEPDVTVAAGATLDLGGCYGLATMTIRLKGGTVTSSRAVGNKDYRLLAAVELDADSTFHVRNDSKIYNYCGRLHLKGHALSLDVNSVFYWNPTGTEGDSGLVRTTRRPYQTSGVLTVVAATDLRMYDLEATVPMNLEADLSVRDYTPGCEKEDVGTAGALKVYGRLKPSSSKGRFYPATMQGGAVLDVSDGTDAWPMTNLAGESLSFEAGGHAIVIDVGTRDFKGKTSVVSWPEGTRERVKGVKFTLNASALAKGYRILSEADGLAVGRYGFVCMFH